MFPMSVIVFVIFLSRLLLYSSEEVAVPFRVVATFELLEISLVIIGERMFCFLCRPSQYDRMSRFARRLQPVGYVLHPLR